MEPLSPALALFVWVFCIFFFLLQDLAKWTINANVVDAHKAASEVGAACVGRSVALVGRVGCRARCTSLNLGLHWVVRPSRCTVLTLTPTLPQLAGQVLACWAGGQRRRWYGGRNDVGSTERMAQFLDGPNDNEGGRDPVGRPRWRKADPGRRWRKAVGGEEGPKER